MAVGVELIARAEQAERALISTRATLAEHVDENLALHRRCAELEARVQELEQELATATRQASEAEVRR